MVPHLTREVKTVIPQKHWSFFEQNAGKPFPRGHIERAIKEIDEFCNILTQEGVNVRRPEILDHSKVCRRRQKAIYFLFVPVGRKKYQRKDKYKNSLLYDYWSKKSPNTGGNIYKFRKYENGTELEGVLKVNLSSKMAAKLIGNRRLKYSRKLQ